MSATLSSHLDFDQIATLLLERMDLQAGENVILVAKPGRFDPLIDQLIIKIPGTGATFMGALSVTGSTPESWQTPWSRDYLSAEESEVLKKLEDIDLGIMMPGASPSDFHYHKFQEKLHTGSGRAIHFHWEGAYDLSGNALEVDSLKDLFYQQVLQNTDYPGLAQKQQQFEQAMRGQMVRVTTPGGTDISFTIGDRPVTKQDGDASALRAQIARNLIDREIELPAGAIRVAPEEESVNGIVAFPDATWGDTLVKGVQMTFENGMATSITAEQGQPALMDFLKSYGPSARSFREFALGINPLLAIQQGDHPWIPYYGYGAGVVRLSLGNNEELGGNVGGSFVRWNFFTDATVYVGDTLWVEHGELVK